MGRGPHGQRKIGLSRPLDPKVLLWLAKRFLHSKLDLGSYVIPYLFCCCCRDSNCMQLASFSVTILFYKIFFGIRITHCASSGELNPIFELVLGLSRRFS